MQAAQHDDDNHNRLPRFTLDWAMFGNLTCKILNYNTSFNIKEKIMTILQTQI